MSKDTRVKQLLREIETKVAAKKTQKLEVSFSKDDTAWETLDESIKSVGDQVEFAISASAKSLKQQLVDLSVSQERKLERIANRVYPDTNLTLKDVGRKLSDDIKILNGNVSDVGKILANQAINKKDSQALIDIVSEIKELNKHTTADNPLAVRLSNGEEFIENLTQTVVGGLVSGGGSVPKVTLAGGVQAVPVVNPDGTDVGGGGAGIAAYSDSSGTTKQGLVDADRHVQIDILSSALPSGAATSAKQDTIIGHLDGVEGLLTTIDADTGNISTKTDTIAGAVAGTEMQVDVVAALPAGNNNIGDVDVASSALPTGASTLAEQQSQTTHLATIAGDTTDIEAAIELIDDAIVADDAAFTPATTKVMMAGFEFDDSTPDSVNEGDAGAARMSANRNVYTTIRDAAGNERGVNVNASNQLSVSVDNTVTVASHAVTNAGTFAVQESGSALTALQLIDDIVYTDDTSTHSTGSSKGALFMAAATPTDGSVNANDIGAVAMTTDRKLHVSVQDALPAGTNAIGKLAANSGVDIGDVDVTSIAAGTNNIGQVSVAPQTANGLSVFNATSSDGATALTNTAQAIKASAGQVYGWYIYNPNSSAQFVQLYNTAAGSVTVGTTNPLFMLTIPATSAANVEFTNGITFSNAGFSCAATSTAGGNGAPSTALDAVIFYK